MQGLNLHMHTKCLNAETLVYKSLREENNVEYDQEIPQFHTTDKPAASWGRVTEHKQSHNIGKTIKVKQPILSSSTR